MSSTRHLVKRVQSQPRLVFWVAFGGVALLFAIVAVMLLNTGDEEILTTYGRRAGVEATSVNGTSVLGELFEAAGHSVRTKRHLSDAMLEKCEVIVWAPDDFEPPSEKVVQWFDQWFAHDERTLIYIARDFDAGSGYYDKVIPVAPVKQVSELKRRQSKVHSEHITDRNSVTGVRDSAWFTLDMQPVRKIKELSGPWSKEIDVSKTELVIGARLKPKVYDAQFDYDNYLDVDHFVWDEKLAKKKRQYKSLDELLKFIKQRNFIAADSEDVLLKSKSDILVSRHEVGNTHNSRIIVVANGSFLLNLPLVNHEHRKLGARLVDEIPSPQMVVFVESGRGGLPVINKEPSLSVPTGFSLFSKRPIDVILFHLAILGIVYCMSRWPIFGRPRRAVDDSIRDFGKHIDALGELLEKTGDKQFARLRVEEYHQSQRTESSTIVAANPGSSASNP